MSRYAKHDVFSDTGELVGHIVFNQNAMSLDAHCHRHLGGRLNCAVNRTVDCKVDPGSNLHLQARGRPLGFLVAWLRAASQFAPGPEGRASHHALRLGRGADAWIADGIGAERQAARLWVDGEPLIEALRTVERALRDGEPLDSVGLP